jgi:glycine cleavage system H protein
MSVHSVVLAELFTSGTVGVSEYAAKALGDVVFVELPSVSQTVQANDQVGAVESVKSASDLYSPVAGEIVATNEAIEQKPALINSSPEAEGWMFKIKITDKSDYDGLMTAAEYTKFSEEV